MTVIGRQLICAKYDKETWKNLCKRNKACGLKSELLNRNKSQERCENRMYV